MTEALALHSRRVLSPLVVFVVVIAAAAVLALGFGLRTWTEHSSPAPSHIVVVHDSAGSQLPNCRIGRPC